MEQSIAPRVKCGKMQLPIKTNSVGFVVPTLGTRSKYLEECLDSILKASADYIVVVAPKKVLLNPPWMPNSNTTIVWVEDPGTGLANAINVGLRELSKKVEYLTWLGDDDALHPEGLETLVATLNKDKNAVAAFGICDYVDEESRVFWSNDFGSLAVPLIRFGPNKIPQPGSLIRSSTLKKINFLNPNLKYAFDLEMFIKLSKIGKICYVPARVAKFRWHANSLSSGQSKESLLESSRVRVDQASNLVKPLIRLTESIHVRLALQFGNTLDKRKSK